MPDTCEGLATEMLVMLQRAYLESHHADKCSHRYSNECSCWKLPARKLMKRAMEAGLKGDKVAANL